MKKFSYRLRWSMRALFMAFLFGFHTKVNAQFYSLNVDVLGLCTTTLNVEGSIAVHNQWTLHLPVRVNPWTIRQRSLQHVSVWPGARYWLIDSYSRGWFAGVNAVLTAYDHSGLAGNRLDYFGKDYRYKGRGYGAGISCGFSIPAGRRMNVEFEMGLAGLHIDQDISNQSDGLQKGYQKGFMIVPGKIGIHWVYLF